MGVSHATIARALTAKTRDDFRTVATHERPRQDAPQTSWTLEAIRAARDAQMRGDFRLATRLSEAMYADDAIAVARGNRIDPLDIIGARLVAANKTTRAGAVLRRARLGVHIPRAVLKGIDTTLVEHGVAIGYIERDTNEDGTRVDYHLHEWPLDAVKWDHSREQLMTDVRGGGMRVPIIHGDGFWIQFSKHDRYGWIRDAALVPAGFVWAAHATGLQDWSASSKSHGMAKIMGELPEGFSLEADESGRLTPEAQAFLDMLRDIVSGASGAGIRPFGSKTEFVSNNSSAWQVFSELIANREKAAARIYLGTDALLGSVGGAPGVDIATLLSTAATKLQGDKQTIESAIFSGMLVPWCAENVGDSTLAPRLSYRMPDSDAQREAEDYKAREDAFFATIERYKANGMQVDQLIVNELADRFGIDPPELAPVASASVPLTLAPTDVAKVVRVREARAAQGLPPFNDERDDLTILQLETWQPPGQAPAQVEPTPTA